MIKFSRIPILALVAVSLSAGAANLAASEPRPAKDDGPRELIAEVHILEMVLRYGSKARRTHTPKWDGRGDTVVHLRNDWITIRSRRIELRPSDEIELRVGDLDYQPHFEIVDEIPRIWLRSGISHHRYRHYTGRQITRRENLAVATTPRPRDSISGGTIEKAFCLFRVHNDPRGEWGPEFDDDTPGGFLRYAIDLFRDAEEPDSDMAIFIMDLARFVPLENVFDDSDDREEILSKADRCIRDESWSQRGRGRKRLRTRARQHNWSWLVEQAALANAVVSWIPEDTESWFERTSGWNISKYCGYRFIAENPAFDHRSRGMALCRSLGMKGSVAYHDTWISKIESNKIQLEEPLRSELLFRLRSEVAGRRPGPLLMMCGLTMFGLIVAVVLLRFFARRVMFV